LPHALSWPGSCAAAGKLPRADSGRDKFVTLTANSNETLIPWISPRGRARCVWAC